MRAFIEDLQSQRKVLKVATLLLGGIGILVIGLGIWRFCKNRETRRNSEETFRRLEQVEEKLLTHFLDNETL